MKWLTSNAMGDEHIVEAEDLDAARDAAQDHWFAWAKAEWAGCWGKRQRAQMVATVVPYDEEDTEGHD